MRNPLSDTIVNVKPSGIRKFFDLVSEMKDAISLGVGEPDFDTPWHIRDEGIYSLEKGRTFYTSNAGLKELKEEIASYLKRRIHVEYDPVKEILVTVGGSEGIDIAMRAMLNPGDEVIAFAPYFVEYGNYVRNYDGNLVVISPDTTDFEPNLAELEQKINARTKAVIINTPNNPTGVVYSLETLTKMADIMRAKEKELGTTIVLLSDEPYRELAYDGVEVPYVTNVYDNTVICYSYSKSLSLPGERIGYLVIPDALKDSGEVFDAATIANRVLGCVNAPSLMQRVIMRCLDAKVNLEAYDRNRNLLYNGLKGLGFECIKPQGAFYLFVKSPEADEKKFCENCKKYNILVVPGTSFACPGYVRISYCVSYEQIERSLPAFAKAAADYGLKK